MSGHALDSVDFAPFAVSESLPPSFEVARATLFSSPWPGVALVVFIVAALAFWWWLYRRDTSELPPGYAWSLLALRLGALAAVGWYIVGVQQRVDRQDVFDSRVAVLVDTSLSMARVDPDLQSTLGTAARWEQVANELTSMGLVERLREKHQVHVYTFDEEPKARLATILDKRGPSGKKSSDASAENDSLSSIPSSLAVESLPTQLRDFVESAPSWLWWSLGMTVVLSYLLAVAWVVSPSRIGCMTAGQWLWALFGSVAPAVPILALAILAYDQRHAVDDAPMTSTPVDVQQPAALVTDIPAVLREKLRPRGMATRLGDALKHVVAEQRNNACAAIVVFTDGGQNSGENPQTIVKDARAAGIPLYIVGIGSDRRRSSVRVSDFAAPARVFPDDRFDVTAMVQAVNFKDRMVAVNLYEAAGDTKTADGGTSRERPIATERVRLGGDGEIRPVKFLLPPAPVGRHQYVVRLETLSDDDDTRDNEAAATVDVVAQQMRVLLVAGGPARDYQYARNLFFRDKSVAVDVLLQTSPPGPGISQDADAILAEFPRAKADLDKYDAVVAIDPDWTALDAGQVDKLVEWVDRRMGGLIVCAGPVHTAKLAGDGKTATTMAKLRELYPVIFARRGLTLATDTEKFRATTPHPVELTRDGLEAPFLRLTDDVESTASAAASAAAWEQFPGVFGYFPVQGAKAGAKVYAHYGLGEGTKSAPVYIAGQFYGGGRVLYFGSSETYRLRALEEAYFERLWTKLVRFVAEGRLLRGTRRGAILLDQRKVVLGERVDVRATLRTADREPLVLDRVLLQGVQPDGVVIRVPLMPDGATPGVYRGDLLVNQQGVYRLEMEAPGAPYELASETLRVIEPDLEADHARRDDALLSSLCAATDGEYRIGAASVRGGASGVALEQRLRDATRLLRVRGAASARWDELWARTLLGVICGLLFTEWTLRRLAKLA